MNDIGKEICISPLLQNQKMITVVLKNSTSTNHIRKEPRTSLPPSANKRVDLFIIVTTVSKANLWKPFPEPHLKQQNVKFKQTKFQIPNSIAGC